MTNLETFSAAKLASIHNAVPGVRSVRKFESKAKAVERTRSALAAAGLDAQGELVKRQAERKATGAKREPIVEGADLVVLGWIQKLGPCKVGAIREAWIKADPKFAALEHRQRVGAIRRSVRRLEAEGKVAKDGMLFSAR